MLTSRADIIEALLSDPFRAHLALFPHRHFKTSAEYHKDMAGLYWSGHRRVVMLCFRGSAKSTLAEETITLKALIKDFQYAVILCATVDRAADRLMSIAKELENNELLSKVFGPSVGAVWQKTRIVLANGVCIDAIGAGQNTRGMKYLASRPSFAFVDDIEEMSRYNDNVSTPERREDLRKWFRGSFLPALAQPNPMLRLCGSMLHEDSLIGRYCARSDWKSLVIPVETISETGVRQSSWPSLFPIEWIDSERRRYAEDGQAETFEQEFMCRATASGLRPFREDMFRFEDRVRTWEPVYVVYDPARTVGPKSCATGKVAASWVGNRLVVWEATQAFWKPDELINDIFESNEKYGPIGIGVETSSLDQFIEQPLRIEQAKRGQPLPLRPMRPPRGPGKENFLLSLQPFFSAGEVIFAGPREKFQALVNELLGFPYGLNDTINALAYMLEIKPGEAVYPKFGEAHVVGAEAGENLPGSVAYVAVNTDGIWSCVVLCVMNGEGLRVVADWCQDGGPGVTIGSMLRSAHIRAGKGILPYGPPVHFAKYDSLGLRPSCSAAGYTLLQGGSLQSGSTEINRLMTLMMGQNPLFLVSREASWTLRALSGGYARTPGQVEAMLGPYRVIGEALETLAGVLTTELESDTGQYMETKDGRRYMSASGIRLRN